MIDDYKIKRYNYILRKKLDEKIRNSKQSIYYWGITLEGGEYLLDMHLFSRPFKDLLVLTKISEIIDQIH